MIPGEIIVAELPAELAANVTLATRVVRVANTGDRPIQVGSHFHFFELNGALQFERGEARGFRLNIPAGTAVRVRAGVFAHRRPRSQAISITTLPKVSLDSRCR